VISQFQPDWIFVPILDKGIGEGRWTHQRAFELSKLSQARFIATSSIAMCYWNKAIPKSVPTVGLAVGPANLAGSFDDKHLDRAFFEARLASPDHDVVVIQWGHGDWGQTTLSATFS
jgi:hypothetical protein